MDEISWIAADWGTTHLRVWAIGPKQAVVEQASSAQGMNSLEQDQFEGAMLELIEDWLPDGRETLVIACGMVGARQGWIEADYVETPAKPLTQGHFRTAPANDPRINVLIVPGMARREPADVMRGEETQIAGLLASRQGFDGVVCVPGTHCKWVQIDGGEVADFKTCMTGELFSLLEQQSILRHSLAPDGLDLDAFETAVATSGAVLTDLFSIRAEDLLNAVPAAVSRARLSACLISAEIAEMQPFWHGQRIVLLGSSELVGLYRIALNAVGADVETVDGKGLTVAGLIAARALIEENS